MSAILRDSQHIARKTYRCDACEAIFSGLGERDMISPEDIMRFRALRETDKRILPGERYIKQVGISDGDFYVYRGCIDGHALALEYDCWE